MMDNDDTQTTYPSEMESTEEFNDDDLVVEDLEENRHDQLPSVEEVKANLPSTTSSGNRKRTIFLILAILGVVALFATAIAIGKKKNKKTHGPGGRTQAVLDFLFHNEVSTKPSLTDTYSAQHRAAVFVADADAYRMDLTEQTMHKFVERYVFALIYYHFGGSNWIHKLNFLDATDHCDWWEEFGSISGETIRQGVKCDEKGHVVELNLGTNTTAAILDLEIDSH